MDAIKIIKKMRNCNFDESIDLSISIKKNQTFTHKKLTIQLPYINGQKKNILLLTNSMQNKNICDKYPINIINDVTLLESILKDKKIRYVIIAQDMNSNIKEINKYLKQYKIRNIYQSKSDDISIKKVIEDIHHTLQVALSNKNKNINISIGRKSYDIEEIYSNIIEVMQSLIRKNVKISFIQNITVTATMSPGVMLDIDDMKHSLTEKGM
jgi:ribosomal protein L1